MRPLNYVNIATLLGDEEAALEEIFWQRVCELRVSVPVVVQSFNSSAQTVTVQVAIQENILQNGVPTPTAIPPLQDVPIGPVRGGGFAITLPFQPGDEGWVIFADMCIDAWWQSGGTANNQVERRRHDLSDAMFLPQSWSQPRVLTRYDTNGLQIRSDDGNTVITVNSGSIVITPDNAITTLEVTAGQISIHATTILLNGRPWDTHIHSGVSTGSADTGPPV